VGVVVARGVVLGVTLLEEAARPVGVLLRSLAATCLLRLDTVPSCKRDLLDSALLSREVVPGALAGIRNGGTTRGLRCPSAGLPDGGCGCKFGLVVWCEWGTTAAASAAAGSADARLLVDELVLLARDRVLSVLFFLGLFFFERGVTPPPSRDVDLSVDVVLSATLLARDDWPDAFPADNSRTPAPCTWRSRDNGLASPTLSSDNSRCP